tara:strand:- start:100 stop:903 length:804 start_codon:yes stop_codon:yes gene_type:complete
LEDLFFIISKLGAFFYKPSNILFFFLIILFFYIPKVNFLIKFVYSIMLLILFFPFGLIILNKLEERIPIPINIPNDIENIIVLGGFEELDLYINRGQLHFNGSSERIIMAVKLSSQFQNSKIVFVGGDASLKKKESNITNSDVVKEFFDIIQFDEDNYLFIKGSRNTHENIKDLKNNLDMRGNNLIITSAFHMPRVVGILKKNNLKAIPYPVDYFTKKNSNFTSLKTYFSLFSVSQNLVWLDFSTREFLALLIYRITNKTNVLFPRI